ncbi:MAG: glycosyl transferase, partial [Terriglobales bacterium]
MAHGTHFEILCAEAERFPQTLPEAAAESEGLRPAAAELARTLVTVPDSRSPRFFARRWQSLRATLEPLLAEVQRPSEAAVSDEFNWLQENTRLLRNGLQETADLCKGLKKTPSVRNAKGRTVPRVMAVVEGYLAAVDYRFDGAAFAAYVGAFEETTVLNVKEIWGLALCLKLVLLERVAGRALRLLKNPAGIYGMADCVRSLHLLAQISWKDLLEPLIVIDRVLRDDPGDAYAGMDFESRERYWNAVANLAEHSALSEMDVATAALALAREARSTKNGSNPRRAARKAHVGYYLVGEGSAILERKALFKPPLSQRIAILLRRDPDAYYLSGIALLTLTVMAAALSAIADTSTPGPLLLAILVLLVPCSQAAVELMNYLTTSLLPVRVLPKLDFSEGIPANCVTMVAVPALLLNEAQVRRLVEDLEVRYLGNRDGNLHFSLLTDLPDTKEHPREDDPLVALCAELIGKLNEKYAEHGRGSFLLLHRHRIYNPREGVWMGWERKRGKLMDFYRLLRSKYDAFPVKIGDLTLLPQVRFVITLDSDTELPRGSAQRMIGALAHPLNQAIVDPRGNLVVAGYGILQPRIGVSVRSASSSRLANIYSGQTGLDLYTRAVSDVYQDLYGEGIFTGKGICEVDALLQVLDHRFPDNALLSHDLIEGAYARAGLASDIELIDEYPSHYSAHNRRKHRWMRGDWQVMEWLRGCVPDATGKKVRNPISLVSRWKILDNLRRSLVEPAIFLLLILGWLALPGSPLRWTVAAILLMFSPSWVQSIFGLLRAAWKRNLVAARGAMSALLAGNLAVLLRLTFMAHQTLLSL